jgi:hypothetical protein
MKKFKWRPWKKRKTFSKKKKYVRRRNDTPSKKKKGCKCYICYEGHFAPRCPKKGKGVKKMIKLIEDKILRFYLEKKYLTQKKYYMKSIVKKSIYIFVSIYIIWENQDHKNSSNG